MLSMTVFRVCWPEVLLGAARADDLTAVYMFRSLFEV
jgi:hypothetical protein